MQVMNTLLNISLDISKLCNFSFFPLDEMSAFVSNTFPFKISFVIFCLFFQGQTVKKGTNLVIHWHKRLPAAMAFVMLSRVQDLHNLHIAGPFDERQIRCVPKALEEAIRLEKVSLSWRAKDVCFLSIASLNIRSLQKHYQDLQKDFKLMQKDVICLQETWLTSPQDENYTLVGYESHMASSGKGKGLATYSKIGIQGTISLMDDENTYQVMKMTVKGITIISVYLSSNCPKLDAVVNFISLNKSEKCVVIGDFNFSPCSSSYRDNM